MVMKKLLLIITVFVLVFLNLRMFGRPFLGSERSLDTPFFNIVKRDPERERIVHTKIKLEHALTRFRRQPDFGQIGLQSILDLVDVELAIVDGLLDGVKGYRLERIVHERNKIVMRALPVVLKTYDHVLSLATMDAALEQKIRNAMARENGHLANALNYEDKETFLLRMADGLEYYYQVIEDIQYALSKTY
jgi:hypothetical protein